MDSSPVTQDPPRRGSGPGWLVAAAFIGPGTVTTATLAGAGYGTVLLWALLFSTLATMALQEMAARLGLVSGGGLGEALRARAGGPIRRLVVVLAVVGAIGIGNAAYETGNLLGGALGLSSVFGGDAPLWALIIGAVGASLLWAGSYRALEKALMVLVGVMALTFLGTALVVSPDWGQVFGDLLFPTVPEGSLIIVVGLIGTTVVPYNLFLHAAAVAEKWQGADALPVARRDLAGSIALGGLVSMAILVTSHPGDLSRDDPSAGRRGGDRGGHGPPAGAPAGFVGTGVLWRRPLRGRDDLGDHRSPCGGLRGGGSSGVEAGLEKLEVEGGLDLGTLGWCPLLTDGDSTGRGHPFCPSRERDPLARRWALPSSGRE